MHWGRQCAAPKHLPDAGPGSVLKGTSSRLGGGANGYSLYGVVDRRGRVYPLGSDTPDSRRFSHSTGSVVTVGVPDSVHQPLSGRANTCQNGDGYRRHVILAHPLDGRHITVHATGHYGRGICGPVVGAADFQLSERDALPILEAPLDKLEEAAAIIE